MLFLWYFANFTCGALQIVIRRKVCLCLLTAVITFAGIFPSPAFVAFFFVFMFIIWHASPLPVEYLLLSSVCYSGNKNSKYRKMPLGYNLLLGVLARGSIDCSPERILKCVHPQIGVKVYRRNKNQKINNIIGFKRNQGISEREWGKGGRKGRSRTRREKNHIGTLGHACHSSDQAVCQNHWGVTQRLGFCPWAFSYTSR